jgi:hypothetical protein
VNTQLIDTFFDSSKPCPSDIPMCEEIRKKYNDELTNLTTTGCSSCAKANLKSRYIEAIWKELSKANTPPSPQA